MYLSENIYNLDPAYAYTNESTRSVVGLLFDTLFTLNDEGKVEPSLAKGYTLEQKGEGDNKEYYMYIEIKEDARWSDNVPVSADDVVFAWKRLLNPNNSFDAAALLFDIKNARAYNNVEVTKDDLGLYADDRLVTIQFEGEIDYDQFILNLTSLALAPLREDIVSKNADWAKKSGIMACSGPFKLSRISCYTDASVLYEDLNYSIRKTDENNKVIKDKDGNDMYIAAVEKDTFKQQTINSFILERNMYYYRNAEKGDNLDKSVTPYRIIVDCSLSDEDIKKAYEAGMLLYIGDIPMSLRNEYSDSATKKDSLSTNSVYFNFNADINGEKLFANQTVRQALSMAIDRETIARDLVFAEVATGLVPTGVFDTDSIKKMFRDNSSNNFKYLTKDVAAAKALLEANNITAANYSFSISVNANDEVHVFVAEAIAAAWGTEGLGFNVTVKKIGTVANNDYHRDVKSVPGDICDDLFDEALREGNFEVAISDIVAYSTDPFSVLAPFAKQFSGQAMDMSNSNSYELSAHVTGFDDQAYNDKMEAIFNTKNAANRSADLHAAEEMLMESLPVIPVVFNQTAYLINTDVLDLNNKILFWETSSNYYGTVPFAKMSLSDKDYEQYTYTCAKFIFDNFDSWKTNPGSYFGSTMYKDLTFVEFADESSNYTYLFKNKTYDFMPAAEEATSAE
jgi:ABC-type oligopeptide transport system substrate-binding subunit